MQINLTTNAFTVLGTIPPVARRDSVLVPATNMAGVLYNPAVPHSSGKPWATELLTTENTPATLIVGGIGNNDGHSSLTTQFDRTDRSRSRDSLPLYRVKHRHRH